MSIAKHTLRQQTNKSHILNLSVSENHTLNPILNLNETLSLLNVQGIPSGMFSDKEGIHDSAIV